MHKSVLDVSVVPAALPVLDMLHCATAVKVTSKFLAEFPGDTAVDRSLRFEGYKIFHIGHVLIHDREARDLLALCDIKVNSLP